MSRVRPQRARADLPYEATGNHLPVQNAFINATPVEFLQGAQAPGALEGTPVNSKADEEARAYVMSWRNQLRQQRIEKVNVWNECWALYRGQEDNSNKEDWQSQIVLPKAWGTVKQAVSVIKRFLHTSSEPWYLEDTGTDDPIGILRSEKMTDILRVFLEKAHFLEEFCVGLETGFIMGLGVWKVDWWLHPRTRMRVQTRMVPTGQGPMSGQGPGGPQGSLPMQPPVSRADPSQLGQDSGDLAQQQDSQYPTQLPQEALLPPGSMNGPVGPSSPLMMPIKETVREEILEGKLSILAVDPYNFYWLPGSKLNRWTGTIEEMEVPKWQLMEMAEQGAFDPKIIEQIGPMKIDEYTKQSWLRFGELPRTTNGPSSETSMVKLTEFYGPHISEGKLVEKHAHIIVANETWTIYNKPNEKWHQKPNYCAFSPLQLPFRTEGVGLVEMIRSIDKSLNQIINLGVDTLLYRLMPLFEFTPDVYENPEELRTGLTPGKILKRNNLATGQELGLRPIEFQDVSPGAAQMSGILDRAHQEGGLVTELQQSLPRWSGAQTATETEAIQSNQQSFFGSLAADIEQFAIAPILEMSLDTMMQYLDTANDPRVASILGLSAPVLAGMSQPEIQEMVQGDYKIHVKGLSGQLEKGEQLQNMIQLMNLLGQNPQAWLPWIKQDIMLRKLLESFRPTIHDLDDMINDPQTAEANRQQMAAEAQHQQMMQMIPELARLAHETELAKTASEDKSKDREAQAHQHAVDAAVATHQAHKPPTEKSK